MRYVSERMKEYEYENVCECVCLCICDLHCLSLWPTVTVLCGDRQQQSISLEWELDRQRAPRVISGHLSYWQGEIPQTIVNKTGQTYMGEVSRRRVAEMGYPGEKKLPRAGQSPRTWSDLKPQVFVHLSEPGCT